MITAQCSGLLGIVEVFHYSPNRIAKPFILVLEEDCAYVKAYLQAILSQQQFDGVYYKARLNVKAY